MRTEKPPLKRCAIYTRKSSEEGLEQEFNSLHAQRDSCEAYIKSQAGEGWRVHPTHYDDGGISGGTMDRPALKALLSDIEAGLVDTIVVYKVDRLTRSLSDFAKIIEVFDRKGVSFVAVTQQFNTTSSMGRLTLNILLSFAQFEREVTGERIRDKFAASKQKGIWMGGLPPLGYDARDRKLVINEPEAEQVRYMFGRYNELNSVALLKRDLDERGMYSKPRWTASGQSYGNVPIAAGNLYHMLRNPVYIGEIRHKDRIYPGLHEPIITPELWQQTQERLDRNRQGQRQRAASTSVTPLAGKLVDQDGERLVATHALKQGRKYRYYISSFLIRKSADEVRRGWRVPAAPLEKLILGSLERFLADETLLVAAWRRTETPLDKVHEFTTNMRGRPKHDLPPDQLFGLVQKVQLQPSGINLHIDLRSIVPGASVVIHNVPVTIARRGIEMRLILSDTQGAPPAVDPALIKALARGRNWFEDMMSQNLSAAEIARREGVTPSYVGRILRLAFVSPAIVKAVAEGRQPELLDAETLSSRIDLPVSWDEQSALLCV